MLQGQKLQQAYLEFIVTYSERKGLDPKTGLPPGVKEMFDKWDEEEAKKQEEK